MTQRRAHERHSRPNRTREGQRESKPWPIALRILLVTAIVASLGTIVWYAPFSSNRVPYVARHFKVDQNIAAGIRVGSDRQQVREFCKQRGWSTDDQGSKIIAVDKNADRSIAFHKDVVITFDFDSYGKLVTFHSEDRLGVP